MRGLTLRERLLLVTGAVGLVVALALVGGLVYAAHATSVVGLRWWAVLATLAVPLALGVGYYLGRIEVRGHLAGLAQGIEAVSEAAQKTADVRVNTAQRLRRRDAPTSAQVLLPFLPIPTERTVMLPGTEEEVEI